MSQSKSSAGSPAKTIRPQPTISAMQITEIYNLLGTALCKAVIPSEIMQQVIDNHGNRFSSDFVLLVKNHIEIITGFEELRVIGVNRAQSAQEAINAMGWQQFIKEPDALESAPRDRHAIATASSANATVLYIPKKGEKFSLFHMGRDATDDEVRQKYESLKRHPIDLWELCAFNAKYPGFMEDYPNATIWLDECGRLCYIAFCLVEGRCSVTVSRTESKWEYGWWLVGVPQ